MNEKKGKQLSDGGFSESSTKSTDSSSDKKRRVLETRLKEHKKEAWENAIDALSRYKFMMFGYWAAIWVHLNQIDQNKEGSPFKALVTQAREMQHEK